MLTMASNDPRPNGRAWASTRIGSTWSSTASLRNTPAAAVGSTQRSAAMTCTPYSRARKTDVAPRPEPRSRTRMPGRRSRSAARSSSSHSGCGPMSRSTSHLASYFEDLGKASRVRWSRAGMPRSSGTTTYAVEPVHGAGVCEVRASVGAHEAVRGEVSERRAAGEGELEVELRPQVAQHLGHAVGAGEGEAVDVRPADADRCRTQGQCHEDVCPATDPAVE